MVNENKAPDERLTFTDDEGCIRPSSMQNGACKLTTSQVWQRVHLQSTFRRKSTNNAQGAYDRRGSTAIQPSLGPLRETVNAPLSRCEPSRQITGNSSTESSTTQPPPTYANAIAAAESASDSTNSAHCSKPPKTSENACDANNGATERAALDERTVENRNLNFDASTKFNFSLTKHRGEIASCTVGYVSLPARLDTPATAYTHVNPEGYQRDCNSDTRPCFSATINLPGETARTGHTRFVDQVLTDVPCARAKDRQRQSMPPQSVNDADDFKNLHGPSNHSSFYYSHPSVSPVDNNQRNAGRGINQSNQSDAVLDCSHVERADQPPSQVSTMSDSSADSQVDSAALFSSVLVPARSSNSGSKPTLETDASLAYSRAPGHVILGRHVRDQNDLDTPYQFVRNKVCDHSHQLKCNSTVCSLAGVVHGDGKADLQSGDARGLTGPEKIATTTVNNSSCMLNRQQNIAPGSLAVNARNGRDDGAASMTDLRARPATDVPRIVPEPKGRKSLVDENVNNGTTKGTENTRKKTAESRAPKNRRCDRVLHVVAKRKARAKRGRPHKGVTRSNVLPRVQSLINDGAEGPDTLLARYHGTVSKAALPSIRELVQGMVDKEVGVVCSKRGKEKLLQRPETIAPWQNNDQGYETVTLDVSSNGNNDVQADIANDDRDDATSEELHSRLRRENAILRGIVAKPFAAGQDSGKNHERTIMPGNGGGGGGGSIMPMVGVSQGIRLVALVRLAAALGAPRFDEELQDEVTCHIESSVVGFDLVKEGMSFIRWQIRFGGELRADGVKCVQMVYKDICLRLLDQVVGTDLGLVKRIFDYVLGTMRNLLCDVVEGDMDHRWIDVICRDVLRPLYLWADQHWGGGASVINTLVMELSRLTLRLSCPWRSNETSGDVKKNVKLLCRAKMLQMAFVCHCNRGVALFVSSFDGKSSEESRLLSADTMMHQMIALQSAWRPSACHTSSQN